MEFQQEWGYLVERVSPGGAKGVGRRGDGVGLKRAERADGARLEERR